MKKIGLVFSLILIFSVSIQTNAQWFWQNPSLTGNHLRAVLFADDPTGWIVGNDGTILKTTSGGINWDIQNSGTTIHLCSVF